jgi:hypothetical protein
MVDDPGWLILAYTLPPEPSRMRVSIWRRLRKLGAVYLDEGIWVAPNTTDLASEIAAVVTDIRNFQGTAYSFVSLDVEPQQRERLRSRFTSARDEEYAELRGQCERFMVHVQHATDTERFTFAEVEELEEEISKLERWLGEIRSRDLFTSPQAALTANEIEKGRQALAQFTERAFTGSDDNKSMTMPPASQPDLR